MMLSSVDLDIKTQAVEANDSEKEETASIHKN